MPARLTAVLHQWLEHDSGYPAAWLGLERELGRIVAGQRADFAVLDDELVVQETWIGGVRYAS